MVAWLWRSLEQQLIAIRYVTDRDPPAGANEVVVRSASANEARDELLQCLRRRFACYDSEDFWIATMLDPRFRHLPWLQPERRASVERSLAAEEKKFYEAKLPSPPIAAAAPSAAQIAAAAAAAGHPLPPPVVVKSALQLQPIAADDRLRPAEQKMESELNRYLSNSTECPRMTAPDQLKFAGDPESDEAVGSALPLSWWKKYGTKLPFLSQQARKWLCIPATSAEPERVWSAAKLLCSDLRGRLNADTIEEHLFLHRNRDLLDFNVL